jgi:hypothetical protein
MTEAKAINGSKGWSLFLLSILGTFFGSGGGVFIYMQNLGAEQLQVMARPDPATGTELKFLNGRFQYHVQNHPDVIHRFDSRLTRLETKVDIILERIK